MKDLMAYQWEIIALAMLYRNSTSDGHGMSSKLLRYDYEDSV